MQRFTITAYSARSEKAHPEHPPLPRDIFYSCSFNYEMPCKLSRKYSKYNDTVIMIFLLQTLLSPICFFGAITGLQTFGIPTVHSPLRKFLLHFLKCLQQAGSVWCALLMYRTTKLFPQQLWNLSLWGCLDLFIFFLKGATNTLELQKMGKSDQKCHCKFLSWFHFCFVFLSLHATCWYHLQSFAHSEAAGLCLALRSGEL